MGVVDQLASSLGQRGEAANCVAAERCLAEPSLLAEIVTALCTQEARLAGDCAEVMTKVAEKRPDLIAPHARLLFTLLGHKNGRVRWEAAHAFALTASLIPELVAERLDTIATIIRSDQSVIVRDHAVNAVAAYGATSALAARRVLPILREVLQLWDGKQAARGLIGLGGLLAAEPALAAEVSRAAQPFADHPRGSLRKAARLVLRAAGGNAG